METVRVIVYVVLGTLMGLILGVLCGFAIGLLGMPQHPTDYDSAGAFVWIMLGAGLGALIGFLASACAPSWRYNLQRRKRLQTLRQQRSLRAFTPADDTWPPSPKGQTVAGAAPIND